MVEIEYRGLHQYKGVTLFLEVPGNFQIMSENVENMVYILIYCLDNWQKFILHK